MRNEKRGGEMRKEMSIRVLGLIVIGVLMVGYSFLEGGCGGSGGTATTTTTAATTTTSPVQPTPSKVKAATRPMTTSPSGTAPSTSRWPRTA